MIIFSQSSENSFHFIFTAFKVSGFLTWMHFFLLCVPIYMGPKYKDASAQIFFTSPDPINLLYICILSMMRGGREKNTLDWTRRSTSLHLTTGLTIQLASKLAPC